MIGTAYIERQSENCQVVFRIIAIERDIVDFRIFQVERGRGIGSKRTPSCEFLAQEQRGDPRLATEPDSLRLAARGVISVLVIRKAHHPLETADG